MRKFICCLGLFVFSFSVHSQGLESIIVEQYYVSDVNDVADTSGGHLPGGSVTYRIYVDMKPGYTLRAVYGNSKHELFIKTTTGFFNNKDCEAKTGDQIDVKKIDDNTVALDSWVSMGAATKSHFGIPRANDMDGSVIRRRSLSVTDGLIKAEKLPLLTFFGLDYLIFFNDDKHAAELSSNNGSWACFGGAKGPTNDNMVLIAQLTTDGELSFELNLQLGTPTGSSENYVAKNPAAAEIEFKGLAYKQQDYQQKN